MRWGEIDIDVISISVRIDIEWILKSISSFFCRHTYWRFLTVYSEYFRCDIVYSLNMGRWNCRRRLWLPHSLYMLLCGEYHMRYNGLKLDTHNIMLSISRWRVLLVYIS
jgi:hypothetical protein